jgi:hypothetical protein
MCNLRIEGWLAGRIPARQRILRGELGQEDVLRVLRHLVALGTRLPRPHAHPHSCRGTGTGFKQILSNF